MFPFLHPNCPNTKPTHIITNNDSKRLIKNTEKEYYTCDFILLRKTKYFMTGIFYQNRPSLHTPPYTNQPSPHKIP